jgi:zinc/manganese transport system permease protein
MCSVFSCFFFNDTATTEIYTTSSSGRDGASGVNVLFGSIFGLSTSRAIADALIASGVAAAVVAIGRPLFFASVDEAVASARGVPVRGLGFAFLGLV